MKPESVKLNQQAANCLKIRDVFLFQSRYSRPLPIPETMLQVEQQFMRSTEMIKLEPTTVGDREIPRLAQFFVDLGTRLVKQAEQANENGDSNETELDVYVVIEAQFLVEYEVIDAEVSDDALKAFSEFNVVHNVWPFWRQHVFDIVKRGGLPRIEVPLFSG